MVGFTTLLGCSDGPTGPSETSDQIVAWTAADDTVGDALMITPATALEGDGVYGVIVTTEITDTNGRSIGRSEAFAQRAGLPPADSGAPVALYREDPEAVGNPYPEDRLVRADGTIHVPERFFLRGIPETTALDRAREALRRGAAELETLRGFSTTAPFRIPFSAPIDLASVTPTTLIVFERRDGQVDLEGLLASGQGLGIDPTSVALGFSFPTQPIEEDLVSVQAVLRDRARNQADPVTLVDPDPNDDLPVGVFAPESEPFQRLLGDEPAVGTLVVGLLDSPDFRGSDGLWKPAWIEGREAAPETELDFLLTLPAEGVPPFAVVLLQHGFGGDNGIALELGPRLAENGLASIAINAVSHGRRGSPLDLLRARPFNARDIFRQSIADQMAVLRAIESGIDIDGNGEPDLDATRMSFLGVSLGGILGATLVAVEEILPVAVLNVAGGRVAFLGQSPGVRNLVSGELAAEVDLTVDDPAFEIYLQRTLESGQHAMDPVDGLNFARRWFLEPFSEDAVHRVLLQEGIGDELVQNESTEALAAAGGLLANTPSNDPDGVSGLWRFDPPGGHGILGRDDVLAQAIGFLTSDGTEIVDPAR